jgi:hypothetical protein
MVDWSITALEMDYRMKDLRDEAEHARLVKLARAAGSKGETLPAWLRAEIRLKDKATWLSCQLQSRLSPGMDAAAC